MQRRAACDVDDGDDGGPNSEGRASEGRVLRRVESIQGAGPVGRALQTSSSIYLASHPQHATGASHHAGGHLRQGVLSQEQEQSPREDGNSEQQQQQRRSQQQQ